MAGHRHRHPSDSQPEPEAIETVDAKSGHKLSGHKSVFSDLDFTELEKAMVIVCHVDTIDYLDTLVDALGESKVYEIIRDTVKKKAEGDEELAMATMFSLALLAGASTMLTAVDEGYVDGDEEDEGEGGSNETD